MAKVCTWNIAHCHESENLILFDAKAGDAGRMRSAKEQFECAPDILIPHDCKCDLQSSARSGDKLRECHLQKCAAQTTVR